MQENGISSIAVLPEGRASKNPSSGQILSLFEGCCRHELKQASRHIKTFADPLTEVQVQILKLLNVPHFLRKKMLRFFKCYEAWVYFVKNGDQYWGTFVDEKIRPWGVKTAYLKGPGEVVFEIEEALK